MFLLDLHPTDRADCFRAAAHDKLTGKDALVDGVVLAGQQSGLVRVTNGNRLAVGNDGEGDLYGGELVGHAAEVGRGLGQVAEGEAGGIDAQIRGIVAAL